MCIRDSIDTVRPDFMLLRVIARGLILWDFIRPTTEWVEAQLPSVLVDSMQALLAVSYSLKSAARASISGDACVGHLGVRCAQRSCSASAVAKKNCPCKTQLTGVP